MFVDSHRWDFLLLSIGSGSPTWCHLSALLDQALWWQGSGFSYLKQHLSHLRDMVGMSLDCIMIRWGCHMWEVKISLHGSSLCRVTANNFGELSWCQARFWALYTYYLIKTSQQCSGYYCPFYRWSNWGLSRLNFSKVTQLGRWQSQDQNFRVWTMNVTYYIILSMFLCNDCICILIFQS